MSGLYLIYDPSLTTPLKETAIGSFNTGSYYNDLKATKQFYKGAEEKAVGEKIFGEAAATALSRPE